MRTLAIAALMLALTSLAGRCGTTARDAKCEDYKPLAFCSEEFQYVCETTEDGCEQCSCVPKDHVRDEVPAAGPQGPFGY